MSSKAHFEDCPAGRDKYHLCICETLRMVRAAAENAKRRRDREERLKDDRT